MGLEYNGIEIFKWTTPRIVTFSATGRHLQGLANPMTNNRQEIVT